MNVGTGGYTCRNVRLGGPQPRYRCVPPGKRDLQQANLIYVPGTGNNGINQLRCLETYPEIIAPRNLVGSNGVVHALDDVMIPFFPDFPNPYVPVPVLPIRSPTRLPTPFPTYRPDTCMCNTGCFGGLQMTYNRRRCDPETTQPNNPQANDYCVDVVNLANAPNPPALLPTGNVVTVRLAIGLYYCDGRANLPLNPNQPVGQPDLLGSRSMITDELTFDLNVRNVQTTIDSGYLGVCLPDCIQVGLAYYDGNVDPPVYTNIQTFNIDTRCAGNSLVSRTNYGAFYYREDFNVQCPVGKK